MFEALADADPDGVGMTTSGILKRTETHPG